MMKPLKISILIFLMFNTVFAQDTRTISDIINQREVKKHYYRLNAGLMNTIVINMQYGQSEVVSNSDRLALKKADVLQIDVVFSDYPKGDDFSALNLSRIKVVENLRKDLVTNTEVNWNIIRQMACQNESEAKILFHGIVIHYRSEQSTELIKRDLSFLDLYLPKEDSIESPETLERIRKSYPDSTIFKVLDRNKSWDKMHIVADLTGSMSPYTSQLILWFQLNIIKNRIKEVTFFNDGDMTPESKKKIGSTGGIYHGHAENYEQLRALAAKTISNGYGGDAPENDCEAILDAIRLNPEVKEVFLIADNWAPIKDISLSDKIKKPVHVILCGTAYGINVQYLNLARDTGGSVHSIEQDLVKLIEYNEGATFTFLGKLYKIKENRIIEVKRI